MTLATRTIHFSVSILPCPFSPQMEALMDTGRCLLAKTPVVRAEREDVERELGEAWEGRKNRQFHIYKDSLVKLVKALKKAGRITLITSTQKRSQVSNAVSR